VDQVDRMGRSVLTILGALWIVFGALCAVWPGSVLDGVGIALGTADAWADARATYGGSQVGIGVFFLFCARADARVRTGLVALASIAGGFGLARILGIAVDGARGGPTFLALAIEVVAFALAWISLGRIARTGAAQGPARA
jgi:hypothetical protein